MRQITVSVLALFVMLPAFADVRLPVVNLAAGSVSARAAFGEPIVKNENKVSQNKEIKVSENNEAKVKNDNKKRSVVARSSVQKPIAVKTEMSKDSGEQIVASADVWFRADLVLIYGLGMMHHYGCQAQTNFLS